MLQKIPFDTLKLIHRHYLGEYSTLPAVAQHTALLEPVSRTYTLASKSVLERIGETARPWPTTFDIHVGDPRWFIKGSTLSGWSEPDEVCKDLGFLQANCKLTVPADFEWPIFTANHGYGGARISDFYYRVSRLTAWSCPCVAMQIPVSLDLGWYTTVPACSTKGYFTVDDLLRLVGDYLEADFDEEQLAILRELTGEPSLEVEEEFNRSFFPYGPDAYSEFLDGDLFRYAGLYWARFGGFKEVQGDNGSYLRTLCIKDVPSE